MEKTLKSVMKKGLSMLEKHAERKATSECFGVLYEPKVPKKLKKTVYMGLALFLMITTVFGISVERFKAASDYNHAEWDTVMNSPASLTYSDSVSLYAVYEVYVWDVTEYSARTGEHGVTIKALNCSMDMLLGDGRITGGESNTPEVFEAYDFNPYTYNGYARFRIEMYCDSYTTYYAGYVAV